MAIANTCFIPKAMTCLSVPDRPDRIEACYAVPRGGRISLFFVPESEAFDFGLADDMTQLSAA
ncbi:MAG: hypothetical protein ACLFUJ_04920 [Phycisphaerae bacterium]